MVVLLVLTAEVVVVAVAKEDVFLHRAAISGDELARIETMRGKSERGLVGCCCEWCCGWRCKPQGSITTKPEEEEDDEGDDFVAGFLL